MKDLLVEMTKRTSKKATTTTKTTYKSFGSYYSLRPKWGFKLYDSNHPTWVFHLYPGSLKRVFTYMGDIEKMGTWRDVMENKSGRNQNTRNHPIPIVELTPFAQKRLTEIGFDDYEELISLALSSEERVWGIIDEGVFLIIWFDSEHQVYPVD